MCTKHEHHTLPKLYLKGFVEEPEKPFIWEYRKGTPYEPGKSWHANPSWKSIGSPCADRDYYAFPHANGDIDFDGYENLLESYEKPANPIFAKLRAKEAINADEKLVFSFYMTQMHRRVPGYREKTRKLLPEVAAKLRPPPEVLATLHWPDTEEAAETYQQIALQEAEKKGADVRTHLTCIAACKRSLLTNYFASMKWRFFVAPKDQGFLTGDNPVFIPGFGLKKVIAQVFFPISTDVALIASWPDHHTEGFFPATSQIVKDVNRRTASSASEKLYFWRAEEWVQRILNKEHSHFNFIN